MPVAVKVLILALILILSSSPPTLSLDKLRNCYDYLDYVADNMVVVSGNSENHCSTDTGWCLASIKIDQTSESRLFGCFDRKLAKTLSHCAREESQSGSPGSPHL